MKLWSQPRKSASLDPDNCLFSDVNVRLDETMTTPQQLTQPLIISCTHKHHTITRFDPNYTWTDQIQPNTRETMSSNSLNYPLLAIPAYYVFSLIPHGYAGSLLSSHGYKINNANPKASLSPDSIKGKVPDAVYVSSSSFSPKT